MCELVGEGCVVACDAAQAVAASEAKHKLEEKAKKTAEEDAKVGLLQVCWSRRWGRARLAGKRCRLDGLKTAAASRGARVLATEQRVIRSRVLVHLGQRVATRGARVLAAEQLRFALAEARVMMSSQPK